MLPGDPTLPADLSKIAPIPGVSPEADANTALEREKLANTRLQAEIAGLVQDADERKKYAYRFFVVSCIWIGVISILLLLQGFGSFWYGKFPFKLSEPVVLATIGSTTLNILGILYIVANYLFPKRGLTDKP